MNIYCKSCQACGEEGCCSPLVCTMDGDYCKGYLADLHFGYLMFNDLYNLICEHPDFKQKVEQIYEKNFDLIYKS